MNKNPWYFDIENRPFQNNLIITFWWVLTVDYGLFVSSLLHSSPFDKSNIAMLIAILFKFWMKIDSCGWSSWKSVRGGEGASSTSYIHAQICRSVYIHTYTHISFYYYFFIFFVVKVAAYLFAIFTNLINIGH